MNATSAPRSVRRRTSLRASSGSSTSSGRAAMWAREPSRSHSTAADVRSSRSGSSGSSARGAVTGADASIAPLSARDYGLRLALIGLAAGLFSALFGVGGGVIIVPLLVMLLAYDAKVATATSLAAIIITASVGTVAHGVLGNVDWEKALLIGVPAMAGVTVGVALKDRISSKLLIYLFAVLLVVVAVRLAVA